MTADYAMPLMALQGDAGATGYATSRQERGREMAICIGIDAAKLVHWAVGMDDGGRVVLDRAVENNPASIIHANRPMNELGCVNSNAYRHLPTSFLPACRIPRRACIALQSHQGHRVISGHSGAAARVAQRPEPSRTASITTMPSPPAYRQLHTIDNTKKRGKAA